MDTTSDEVDGYDETWCFYNGEVFDDEIHELLKGFKKGVRILIISDSCFSGTIIRDIHTPSLLWGSTSRIELEGVTASVRLISSSQEYQLSREERENGLFTSALLTVWDNGNFEGNYNDFYNTIINIIPYGVEQVPNHLIGGSKNIVFDNSKPFTFK